MRNILILLFVQFTVLLFSACNTHKSKSIIDGMEVTAPLNIYSDRLNRTELINNFISDISKYNEIRWTYAFTGEKSEQALKYEWLAKWATNDELLALLDNSNTHVRVYAFLCLADRKNINFKTIVLNHLKDTAGFEEVSGCLGKFQRVNSFFFEAKTGWFTEKEVLTYRKTISKLNAACKFGY